MFFFHRRGVCEGDEGWEDSADSGRHDRQRVGLQREEKEEEPEGQRRPGKDGSILWRRRLWLLIVNSLKKKIVILWPAFYEDSKEIYWIQIQFNAQT